MAWLPKKSVVVPCDFSDESVSAIDTSLDLVDHPSAIHVITVLPEMEVADPGVVWDTVDDDHRTEHAKSALERRLDDEKYHGIDIFVDFGDPGHQIAHFAENIHAELIVLPSHGTTGLKRLLIGSVAERVVRLSHCPVLVLRS